MNFEQDGNSKKQILKSTLSAKNAQTMAALWDAYFGRLDREHS
jgi:hypothetical protein